MDIDLATAQAVVFDFDGLLADTEPSWERAERHVWESLGGRWTADVRQATYGASLADAAAALARGTGRPEAAARVADRLLHAFEDDLAVHGVPLLPGAEALVRELHGRVPLGVASNSPPGLLRRMLTRTGLRDAFDTVVGAEAPLRPKPAPDVYLAACAELNAAAPLSYAFEDSPSGIAAARTAGLRVIGIGPRARGEAGCRTARALTEVRCRPSDASAEPTSAPYWNSRPLISEEEPEQPSPNPEEEGDNRVRDPAQCRGPDAGGRRARRAHR
ncbi:HAD family hydrolase [Streptomyces sp. YU58]|uniref:HAD family hydrolase n=1 Tax=Streptomyces sp. SX92 TaxID=3158972 RepID=UPI0027BAAC22|nr:HAD family phosphatase [Streptomyces coralus]WLW58197.1 HAD family phosphatase [Streptomyces coralus]